MKSMDNNQLAHAEVAQITKTVVVNILKKK